MNLSKQVSVLVRGTSERFVPEPVKKEILLDAIMLDFRINKTTTTTNPKNSTTHWGQTVPPIQLDFNLSLFDDNYYY
jgi:hypothetical protein